MLKLLLWLIVLGVGYLFYRGRQELAARRDRELDLERERREAPVVDVEAEDVTTDNTAQR